MASATPLVVDPIHLAFDMAAARFGVLAAQSFEPDTELLGTAGEILARPNETSQTAYEFANISAPLEGASGTRPVKLQFLAADAVAALPAPSLAQKLLANGDINFWDREISLATSGQKGVSFRVLLMRGANRAKVLKIRLPHELMVGENRALAFRYLAASIYNEGVADGVEHAVISMRDKAEEEIVSHAVAEEVRQRYEKFHVYANFGEPITISNSRDLNVTVKKDIQPKLMINPKSEADNILVGIDVGGTNIKASVVLNGTAIPFDPVTVDRRRGGEALVDQVLDVLKKIKDWVDFNHPGKKIASLGLTFPAPVKKNPDGTFQVVRLTNFERYWAEARGGNTNFEADYKAINAIGSRIREKGIEYLEVMNDADAFGFGEIFHRIEAGTSPEKIGTKVVLPIGTGPGYVKINRGVVENIPNQGGHMVIDLSDTATTDPGCLVKGCYGGFVPASAYMLRAKALGLKTEPKNERLPSEINDALRMLYDIAEHVAMEAVKVHKITGADEVILAGGIAGDSTGKALENVANDFIAEKYPEFKDKVRVVLSRYDLNNGGAIGAAHYAFAAKTTREHPRTDWDMKYNLPETQIGKKIISGFFKKAEEEEHKKVGIVIDTRVKNYLAGLKKHLWFLRAVKEGRVLEVKASSDVEAMVEAAREKGFDMIVPIGGGMVTDWGKYIGTKLEKEVVVIPSTLSGNGMFTEKAIFYKWNGNVRERQSHYVTPASKVIVDLKFIGDMFGFDPKNGVDTRRANVAGSGDILSIYPALLDWRLAIELNEEREDDAIMEAAERVFTLVAENAELIRTNSDIGLILLTEAMAEASLLNMRFGSSRPKDGGEHLLADEIDALLPRGAPRLHGEQVAIAAIVVGRLYSSKYDSRDLARIRAIAKALGLPTRPEEIGANKEIIIKAMLNLKLRADKFTKFNDVIRGLTPEGAEEIYEKVFGSLQDELKTFTYEHARYVNGSVEGMYDHINGSVIPNLDPKKTHELINLLFETRASGGRVIINAAGRIGEVAVFFQQKLRALGFSVDDIREITPEFLIGEHDLVLTLSGSGKTSSVVDNLKNVAELHRKDKLHRRIFSITATPRADTWDLGKEYHTVMEVKGRSKDDVGEDFREADEYLPLSTTFELSTLLYLEGIVETLTKNDENISEADTFRIVNDVVEKTPAEIRGEVTGNLVKNERITANFIDKLIATMKDGRLYFFGLGQNNYVIRLFARRMQNIGFDVQVPGPRDIVSSSRPGDVAIFVSNSGARPQMMRKIRTANEEGLFTVVITADEKSDLAREANMIVPIMSKTTTAHTADIMGNDEKSREARHIKRTFELASIFYLEGVSVALMKSRGMESKDLRHVRKEWE